MSRKRILGLRNKTTSGGRNLTILGIVAVAIAVLTTCVSLIIYHNSGDIYLDRSRPGFLPDEQEIEEDTENENEEYSLPEGGSMTRSVLDEYLKHLEEELKAIDAYEDPFGSDVLSDEYFGIPVEENENKDS